MGESPRASERNASSPDRWPNADSAGGWIGAAGGSFNCYGGNVPFPNTVSYNAAIKACGDACEWDRAVALLEEMRIGYSVNKTCAEGTSGYEGEHFGDWCDAAPQVGVAGPDGKAVGSSEVGWSPSRSRPSPDATSYYMEVTAPLLLAVLIDRMRSSTVPPSAPALLRQGARGLR